MQASLNSIRMKTMAMAAAFTGASLSIGGMLNKLKDVAREAGRANIALKNVSKSAGDFRNNVNYLRRLSTEFGQDIVSLTSAFAKFKAAADASGMSAEAQEKIFRSLTHTITAFGLGNQEASLSFYAISQMMAKGKISAEELRRQLGERIPTAMQAMANAAGVPISKLDDLLKQGKLLSKDIMPKFAEQLEILTPNVNTDNLETSLNRQKNTLVKLAEDWDIYGKFKYVVDKITGLLDLLRNHIGTVASFIAGISLGNRLRRGLSSFALEYKNMLSEPEKNLRKLESKALRKESVASKEYDRSYDNLSTAKKTQSDNFLKASDQKLRMQEKAQERYNKILVEEENKKIKIQEAYDKEIAKLRTLEQQKARVLSMGNNFDKSYQEARAKIPKNIRYTETDHFNKLQAEQQRLEKAIRKSSERIQKLTDDGNKQKIKSAQRTNAELIRLEKEKRKTTSDYNKKEVEDKRRVEAARARVEKAGANYSAAQQEVNSVQNRIYSLKFKSAWTTSLAVVRNAWRATFATIKSAMMSIGFGLVIGGIMAIANWLHTIWTEADKLKEKLADMKNEYELGVEQAQNTGQVIYLQRILDAMQERIEKGEDVVELENEAANALGEQYKKGLDYQGLLQKRIEYLKEEAKLSAINDATRSYGNDYIEFTKKQEAKGRYVPSQEEMIEWANLLVSFQKRKEEARDYRDNKDRNEGNLRLYRASIAEEKAFAPILNKLGIERNSWNLSYSDEFKEFVAQLGSAKLYAKSRDEGIELTDKLLKDKYAQRMRAELAAKEARAKKGGNGGKSDLQKAEEKFAEEYRALQNRLKLGVITATVFAEELQKLSEKTRLEIGGLLGEKAKNNKTYQKADSLYQQDYEVVKAKAEYVQGVAEATRLNQRGLLTEDELISAKAKLARAEVEALLKKEELTDADEAYLASRLAIIAEDSELAKIQREYKAQMANLAYQKGTLNMTDEAYKKAQEDLTRATLERTAKLQGLTPEQQKERNKQVVMLKERLVEQVKLSKPKQERRDKTFDFEKTKSEVFRLDAENLRKYAEALKVAQKNTGAWEEEIKKLIAQADSLDEAFKFQKLNEAISRFEGDIFKGAYNGMKNIASSANNLMNALDGLDKAFDPESKAKDWERFFIVFNTITQVVDGVLSAVDMVNNLIKVIDMLTAAEEALTVAKETGIIVEQVKQSVGDEGAAKAIVNVAKEVAASNTITAAKTTETVAKTTAAHASIPFVGIAIAGAMVGAMLAMILSSKNSVPKFAEGGIVPGALSNGDRVLARLNPGELILNQAQQRNIAGHLQGAGSREIVVKVKGELSGRDVLRLVENAERRKNR